MRICIMTMGTRGDVQPYIALGLGLKAVGHEVTIATLGEFHSLLDDYGMQHAALRGDFLKAAQSEENKSAITKRGNSLHLIRQYIEMARETLEDEWSSARHAQVFIYSPAAIGAYHIAEKLGVPAFAAFPAPLYSPTQEFPSPFLPVSNLGPFNKLSHKIFAQLGPAIYRRPVNEWRKDVLGLPPAKGEDQLHGRPITKLYAYSEVVVPRPADWDESSLVTGYWFLDAPDTWQPDDALVQFLEKGPPPIYIGFGSMFMNGGTAKTNLLLDALRLTGQRGLIATGWGGLSPANTPDDVFVVDAVPHDWLFSQVAAVVHHGGAGTTGAALRAGKPTIICPFVGDQPFWGRRVAALGVGPNPIPQRRLTTDLLAGAIRRVIFDEGMRRRAAVLGEMIRREDGVKRAVERINHELENQP